ncbi:MAG: hypothetical protein ABI680_00135 [Chthoniobacteraceae bacterium]
MSHHHHPQPPPWKPHRDWRVVCAAVLMLIAMVIYVMTLDESVVPSLKPAAPTPVESTP